LHDKDCVRDLSAILNNYNDYPGDNPESDNKPLLQPSTQPIIKRPSNYLLKSRLGKFVAATGLTSTLVFSIYREHPEVYIVSDDDNEYKPVLLTRKKAFT